jgi:NAD(P)-dependent dehydrogenase (short-subunit alcohol dehydrogenase family)
MTDATMSLDRKRVVAIGGSSGIGYGVAALVRERGAEVVIASSNAANVDAAVARLPGAKAVPSICATRPACAVFSTASARSIISL